MSEDQLLTFGEVSIALAGFAGIIATFQSRGQPTRSRGDVLGLTTMVTMALVVAAMSVVPIAIKNFGISESSVWASCSLIFALIYVAFLLFIRSRMVETNMRGANRIIIFCWWVYNFLVVLALLTNVTATDVQRQYGIYFVALLNPLFFSGYMFVRLLLRPLWRDVRNNKA